MNDPAVLDVARIPSDSEPGKMYDLVRHVGGWTHADTSCRGWLEHGRCHHVNALEERMPEEETRLVTVQANPLALLDAVELEQVMNEKLIPSEKHIYSFQVKGQKVEGVSIDGVRDAARALSTKGEAIREQWVRLDREDERDAYFIACAARYAVAPDGREICMDTAIRGKRQPKYLRLRDGGEQYNENWYEIGVAKAVRNATEALLPEALKDFIKNQARALSRGEKPAGAPPPTPRKIVAALEKSGKFLRETQETWDADAHRNMLVRLNEQFPGVLNRDGNLIVQKIEPAQAEEIWTWLQRTYVEAPPTDDGAEQGALT